MRRLFFLIFLLATASLQGEILKVKIEGVIDPITSEFIAQAVREAESRGSEFLLIELSTPGGLGISMQEIVQEILNSQVPVVCFVTPRGAHAASAGFFVLLAADIAAMSPGTNTGSAHPVFPFGMEDETLLEKVRNDALANLRSIVQQRERNYEMAEKAVVESKSYTAQEALEGGLIDLIAEGEQQLLKQLEGREVRRFTGETQVLRTQGMRVEVLEMSFRQRVLSTIADPNLALILGVIGLLGLYLEFTNPGLILPGVIGGICFLLSLLGFSLLPVNLIGVLLIVLALGLFVAEATVQGFGLLGMGGVIAMILGLLFLVDAPYPELRINWGMALAVTLPFAAIFILLIRLAVKSFWLRVTTGQDGLAGLVGTARSDINHDGGRVFVNGELWQAFSRVRISKGSRVRVVRAEDLLLEVEPHESPSLEQSART